MNYLEMTDHICTIMGKVGQPLTEDQRAMLAGALGVFNANVKAERDRYVEFVTKWKHDGLLQTFESRELFRKEAQTILDEIDK